MLELLRALCDFDCLARHEEALRDFIVKTAAGRAGRTETDIAGNLRVWLKGERRPARGPVVLAAPMDEVGFVLSDWGDCGCVKLTQMDQMDVKAVIGRRFRIAGRPETKGVISLASQHLAGNMDSVPMFRDVQMDFGATNGDRAKELVKLGEQAVYDYPLRPFGEGLARGKALECRVGVAALLRVILETTPKYDTCCLFLSSKYLEHRGAVIAARDIDPHIALLVDYAAAGDVPPCEEHMSSARLGQGPALALKEFGSIYSRPLREQVKAMAERAGIRWQYRSGMYGQTDAGALHTYGSGAAVAGISVPVRYALTANPVASLRDIEDTAALVKRFAAEVDEDAL